MDFFEVIPPQQWIPDQVVLLQLAWPAGQNYLGICFPSNSRMYMCGKLAILQDKIIYINYDRYCIIWHVKSSSGCNIVESLYSLSISLSLTHTHTLNLCYKPNINNLLLFLINEKKPLHNIRC